MYDFWMIYGVCVPELQTVALRIASQVASSSSSERAFKDMSGVTTLIRNRMDWSIAQDIMYVRSGRRLLNAVENLDWCIKVIPDAGGWDEDVTDVTSDAEEDAATPPPAAQGAGAAAAAPETAAEPSSDSESDVDEREDDLEPEDDEGEAEEQFNPIAEHLAASADRLEILGDAAEMRREPRELPPPADAEEREERLGRARQRPARFRD